MSDFFRAAFARKSDHYALKCEWAKRFWQQRLRRGGRRTVSRYAPSANIVGIGIGEKVTEGRATGVPCLKIHVIRKVSKRTLAEKKLIIRSEIAGIPTDIEQVGRVRYLAPPISPGAPEAVRAWDPLRPGCSIGFQRPGASRNAGTLGAIVHSAEDGRCLLSNSHVLADLDNPGVVHDITQPGTLDDPTARTVARFIRGHGPQIDGNTEIDAAIAQLPATVQTNTELLEVGAIEGTRNAFLDMIVEKYGRTTGYQAGRVMSTAFDPFLETPQGPIQYNDQIAIRGLQGMSFSDLGDSGALVLERVSNLAVGLLFANDDTFTYANHLDLVLSKLGVELSI